MIAVLWRDFADPAPDDHRRTPEQIAEVEIALRGG
jgi:hypothetical protein